MERVVDEMLSQRTAEIEEMLTEIMEEQGMVFPVAGGGGGGRRDADTNDGDDEGDGEKGREKDKDGDSDMAVTVAEAVQAENRHVELPAPALVPLVQEQRKSEDVIVVPAPPKRVSRFDDTIGLHLMNRPPTANAQNTRNGAS